ncbi:MAG: hypothetical protein ACXWW4_09115, partial [Candidatus Binatia bacterium]
MVRTLAGFHPVGKFALYAQAERCAGYGKEATGNSQQKKRSRLTNRSRRYEFAGQFDAAEICRNVKRSKAGSLTKLRNGSDSQKIGRATL